MQLVELGSSSALYLASQQSGLPPASPEGRDVHGDPHSDGGDEQAEGPGPLSNDSSTRVVIDESLNVPPIPRAPAGSRVALLEKERSSQAHSHAHAAPALIDDAELARRIAEQRRC